MDKIYKIRRRGERGLFLLGHFDGKVLVGYCVVPCHVLANDGVEKQLPDGGDLLEGRVIGQVNGDAGKYKVDDGDNRVENEKGFGVLEDRLVLLVSGAVLSVRGMCIIVRREEICKLLKGAEFYLFFLLW